MTLNTKHYIELEYKYDIGPNPDMKGMAKKVIKAYPKCVNFLDIVAYDIYYTRSSKETLRIRYKGVDGRKELTYKKLIGHKNVKRKEINIKVSSSTNIKDCMELYKEMGFQYDFKLKKDVIVIEYKDIFIALYSSIVKGFKTRYFLEIEAKDESFISLTKWDKRVKKLFGITNKNKEFQSIFEIFSNNKG